MDGRILAIGDIHGCHEALVSLLSQINVTVNDTLVVLGDVVDRGPSSALVIDRLLSLSKMCKVIHIMGNHEEMMRDAISGRGLYNAWLEAGGQATLSSYGGSVDNIPSDHIRFLLSGEPYYETDGNIFIHASLEWNVSMPNQTSGFLRWKRISGSERRHVTGKRIICGHTPQPDGIPFVFDGWVCIDTFAYGGQWLSCLDVNSDHIYQASQKGEFRDFPLARYS